jgi:hypothetical protein
MGIEMVKDKCGKDIEFEWFMIIQFLVYWGVIFLLTTVCNFGWFIAFQVDLNFMWISNTTASLPLTIVLFYWSLISSEDDYDYWGK